MIEVLEMTIEEVEDYVNLENVKSPPHVLSAIRWFLLNKKE